MEDLAHVLERVKNEIAMDDVFKFTYKVFVKSFLYNLEPEWHLQVKNLPALWEPVGKLIDHTEFYSMFSSECADLKLPCEDYDMKEAFEKVNNEWSEELMLAMADSKLKWFDDDIPEDAEIVKLEDGCIIVDSAICKLYASLIIKAAA